MDLIATEGITVGGNGMVSWSRFLSWVLVLMVFAPRAVFGQTHALGGRAVSQDEYESIPMMPRRPMGRLPASVDLAESMPPPGHQGDQPSCTAWSVAYALKTFQEREERGWALTPDHVFSPAFFYNQLKASPRACVGGISFPDALNLLTSTGALPLSVMPYDPGACMARPPSEVLVQAAQYRANLWRRVNYRDPTEVKTQLVARLPVLISVSVDDGFDRLREPNYLRRSGAIYEIPHAMIVVGYDDARGAWRVMNSWGATWGDGGFAWIGYEVFAEITKEAYVVIDEVATDPTPAPGPPAPVPAPVARPGEQVVSYRDGSQYVGAVVEGRRVGHGVMSWSQGDRYDGDWRDDQRTGHGTYHWAGGNRYEGGFDGGKLRGRGILTTAQGYRYEGDFDDDLRHGRGVETLSDGTRYEGGFERGRRQGRGVMTLTDHSRYEGEFRDGQWDGEGEYVGANGGGYIGHFLRGRFDGRGVLSTRQGNRYEGEFRQGRFQGQGTYRWPDGEQLSGFFSDGNPVMGERVRADGTRLLGRFDVAWHFLDGSGLIVYADGSRWQGGIRGSGEGYDRDGTGLLVTTDGRRWLGLFEGGRCLRWAELRADGSVTSATCR